MKTSRILIVFLLFLSSLLNAQYSPGIKVGYSHYGSKDILRFKYNNVAVTNYRRRIEVHNYNFPIDFKLRVSRTARLGLRYAYGKYTAKDSIRAFLPSENISHTLALQCDLYLNPDMDVKVYFSPGLGMMFLSADEMNPFYVGYETPYQIHSKWLSKSFNMDVGVLYEIPKSRFSLEGVLGFRFAILHLKKMRYGNIEVSENNFETRIYSSGGIFEIGLCYMFYPAEPKVKEEKR